MTADKLLAPGEYFGTPAVRQTHTGCLFSERSYGPGQHLPKHCHEAAFFCLLLSGNYSETYVNKEFDYAPHSIVFHPSGEVHRTQMGSAGGRVFLIEIMPPLTKTMGEFRQFQNTHVDSPKGPLSWLALQLRHVSISGEQYPLLVEDLLLQLLSRIAFPANDSRFAPRWLDSVIDYIHSRWHLPIRIGEIASEVRIHPFHLSRVFRHFQGITIADYILDLRIDRAKAKLQRSPQPNLCDLALDLGFADQSHFSRVFKRRTGISPASYRDSFR